MQALTAQMDCGRKGAAAATTDRAAMPRCDARGVLFCPQTKDLIKCPEVAQSTYITDDTAIAVPASQREASGTGLQYHLQPRLFCFNSA